MSRDIDELIVLCPKSRSCVHQTTCAHAEPHLLTRCIAHGQPVLMTGKQDRINKCPACEERGHVTTTLRDAKEEFQDSVNCLRAIVARKREFFDGTLR